ncbi:FAD binding-containing protein [Naviculisporaceae sp. PSN 640]
MLSPAVPESAIIIGGSMTGLLQGLSLKQQGCNVTILERDADEQRLGHESGIQIGPSFLELLNKYDRTGRRVAFPRAGVSWTLSKNGRKIAPRGGRESGQKQCPQVSNWTTMYHLLRANFDGLVSATVPIPPQNSPETDGRAEYRAGKIVTGIAYQSGKVHVTFRDVKTQKIETLAAAMVFAADGINSTVRNLMAFPNEIEQADYLAWRGTACEELVSEKAIEYFENGINFVYVKDTYFVVYVVPSSSGDLTRGKRLINWVWYSPSTHCHSRTEIFTDTNEALHRTTVPQGLLDQKVWASQLDKYQASMPDVLAEVVSKTLRPYVTKVADSIIRSPNVPVRASPRPDDLEAQPMLDTYESPYSAFDGRLVVIGDALSTFRPHMGMATEQSAFHVKQMERLFKGEITMAERDTEARLYAEKFRLMNRAVGFMGLRRFWKLTKTVASLVWFMFKNRKQNRA